MINRCRIKYRKAWWGCWGEERTKDLPCSEVIDEAKFLKIGHQIISITHLIVGKWGGEAF